MGPFDAIQGDRPVYAVEDARGGFDHGVGVVDVAQQESELIGVHVAQDAFMRCQLFPAPCKGDEQRIAATPARAWSRCVR